MEPRTIHYSSPLRPPCVRVWLRPIRPGEYWTISKPDRSVRCNSSIGANSNGLRVMYRDYANNQTTATKQPTNQSTNQKAGKDSVAVEPRSHSADQSAPVPKVSMCNVAISTPRLHPTTTSKSTRLETGPYWQASPLSLQLACPWTSDLRQILQEHPFSTS